jgi:drug/metabolite transporter (DMT)-like permease
VLLGEMLRPIQTLGIIFVLAAIVMVQRPSRRDGVEGSAVIEPIE